MQTPQYLSQQPSFLYPQFASPNMIQPIQQFPQANSSALTFSVAQPQTTLQAQPIQQAQPLLMPIPLSQPNPSGVPLSSSFIFPTQIGSVSNLPNISLGQQKTQNSTSTPSSSISPISNSVTFPNSYPQPQLPGQQTLQQQQIIMQQVAKVSERVEEVLTELKKLDTRISNLETVNSQLLTYSKHQTVKLSQQEDDLQGSNYKAKNSVSKNTQTSFEAYRAAPPSVKQIDADAALARELQEKFNNEAPSPSPSTFSSLPSTPHASSPYYSSLYSSSSSIPSNSLSTSVKSHTCPICSERFATNEQLELHVNSHFDEEQPKATPKEKDEGFLSKLFGSGTKKETKPVEPERKRPASVSLPPTTYPAPYYPGAPYGVQPYPYPQTPMYYYPPETRPK